jgi:hypothetical protein
MARERGMAMTAAIYARKSTDQSGVSVEQRSVARQVEHARAYAARKGVESPRRGAHGRSTVSCARTIVYDLLITNPKGRCPLDAALSCC